jgi:hypothetical protein
MSRPAVIGRPVRARISAIASTAPSCPSGLVSSTWMSLTASLSV